MTSPCPEIGDLDRHASGDLEDAASRRIRAHLQGCPSCRSLLDDISENLEDIEDVREALRADEALPEPAPPERIGPFRIVREIGRGGAGVVYLAEQEKPRREVALKVLHPGSASAETLRRFELEAEALGRLKHPGIAAIHAAGVARVEGGGGSERVPYFAMEYVRGERLDRYVRDRGLDLRQRLDLLARVADAVHHAHLNGIVHRDLKPGNILVEPPGSPEDPATGEGVGAPKILDFGVARAVGPGHAAETLRTSAGQILGTVPYMSPEQLAGDPGMVDARSDVYALGVIGYEILAGSLPHELRGRPLAEAARIIGDQEPHRLGTVDPRLRGDVDVIFTKALEKEPSRRYQSASELASDIRRFLADQAILARPPSTVYQLRKIVRRNRIAFGMASTLALTLVALAVSMAVFSHRARRAEHEAQAQARSAEEMLDFVLGMFSEAIPGQRNPSEISVRELVDRAAARIPELEDQPGVQARMMYSLGGVYYQLGLYEQSRSLVERSLEIRRRVFGEGHAEVGLGESGLGRVLLAMGDFEAAERHLRAGAAIIGAARGENSLEYIEHLERLGHLLRQTGRHDEAIAAQRQVLEARRHALGPDDRQVVSSTHNLAVALTQAGRADEAEPIFRETLAGLRRIHGDRHREVAKALHNLAAALRKTDRTPEAEPLFRESLAIRRELLGDEHPEVASELHDLGGCLAEQGRHTEAEPLLREALAIRARMIPEHWFTAETRSVLGATLAALGRGAEAESLLVESAERIAAIRGPEDEFALRAKRRVGDFRQAMAARDEEAEDRGRRSDP